MRILLSVTYALPIWKSMAASHTGGSMDPYSGLLRVDCPIRISHSNGLNHHWLPTVPCTLLQIMQIPSDMLWM